MEFFLNFFLGLSKIMVATGITGNTSTATNSVEILDLSSTFTQCKNFPNFPRSTFGASGEMDNNGNPIVCGGDDPSTNKCESFVNGSWVSSEPLALARYVLSMLTL